MDVSVILCTYNRQQSLGRALESLMGQETEGRFSFEIVVVDDGSTDGTRDLVEAIARISPQPVRYLRNVGKGQARGTNVGILATNARWIALFDDDQVADRFWLAKLVAAALRTGAACVGSRRVLHFPDGAAPALGRVCRELLGEHACATTDERYPAKLFPQGGSALVDRIVFEPVGYFREELAFGGYDTDFFRAAREAGFLDRYAHDAIVYHVIPAYRASRSYFRWASRRMGASFARMDRRSYGLTLTVLNCAARMAQAALVNVPRLVWALVCRDETEKLERMCLLWRAEAYCRQTARYVLPRFWHQEDFFRGLNFRDERNSAMADQGPK